MGGLFGFVVGVIVGVIGAWWFFERRDAESREGMEAGWRKKLDHAEAEVRRADTAHEETKEQLRRLEQERLPAPDAAGGKPVAPPSPAAPAPAHPAPASPAPASPAPASPAPASPAPASPAPASEAPRSEAPVSEAERLAQARRRIDAKLAQLPAGSSARARLLAERAALERSGGGETGGEMGDQSRGAEAPLFTPPAAAPDDLERIRGIGPVLKARLNKLGITTFAQIAAFSEADLAQIDDVLDFKGRIARERWVEQARELRLGD